MVTLGLRRYQHRKIAVICEPTMRSIIIMALVASASASFGSLQGWESIGRATAEKDMELHLALESSTASELHDLFLAVSDP